MKTQHVIFFLWYQWAKATPTLLENKQAKDPPQKYQHEEDFMLVLLGWMGA
jgi:hypothetical protein